MATRLKTVAFPLPNLSSIPNNTLTNFTQITVDLPESSKTFKKVWVDFMANDIITATGGTLTTKSLGCRVGSASYTTVTNSNTLTNTAENLAIFLSQDFTSHFVTNWSGTSMTFDLQVQMNQSTGTTLGFVSGTAILWVTYEYDDTSTTQVMNAWIPFDSSAGALGTTKPGTASGTIPNLDSFLGYSTISYKHIMLIMESNEHAISTTDFTVSVEVDTLGSITSDTHERALASDRFVREHFNLMASGSPIFSTNSTHSLYWWGSAAACHHAAWTMLVVFTFDASSSNDGNISLLCPMELDSPMGGTTSSDAQKATRELWIEEPATVSIQDSAFRLFWDQVGAISALNARCGTQSYRTYTDTAAVLCGSNVLQRTCHDNISLARGRNTLSFDIYRTDTTDKGWNVSGLWIINYKCGKPSAGWGAANHTVIWNLLQQGTAALANEYTVAATAPTIPETDYFIVALGTEMNHINAAQVYGFTSLVERLSAEGGVQWERVYIDMTHTDPEIGRRIMYSQMRVLFKRFPNDADTTRIDIETSRRWRIYGPQNVTAWYSLNIYMTYHSIIRTISGTVSGSNGGTVYALLLAYDTNEVKKRTSRTGNGTVSFTWYDDTEDMVVVYYEDDDHTGLSAKG